MKDAFWGVLAIAFWVGVAYLFLGGIFSSSDSDSAHTVNIDCRLPAYANDPICNGTYEGQIQQQDYEENSYYQNVVR